MVLSVEAETSINQRVKYAREVLNIKQDEVAEKANIKRTALSKIENGKQEVPQVLLTFYNSNYGISAEWLLTGEGGIFKEDNGKILAKFSEVEFVELPFVPVRAYATFAENCYQSNFIGLETTTVMKVEGVDYNKAIVIEISGNSMGGKYTHGTRVMARQVPEGNWEYASGVHAVAVRDMFLIKRITDNRLTLENTLVLSSDNPDHGSIVVKRADINCMWKVGEVVYSPAE